MPDGGCGCIKLNEGCWRSIVPCVAWKEWNSMGLVDLVWIEVEIVVSTPEKKTTVGVNTISSLHQKD